MAVPDYERNQLFNWLEENMGKERASTMMSLLPPVSWADVATKRDLDAVEERLGQRIHAVDERLGQRIDALATRAELHEMRADLQRSFVTWMVGMHAALVGVIGLMLSVMR